MGKKGSAPASCACFCGMYGHVYVPETWSSQGGLVSSVGVIPLLRAGMHARHLYLAEFCGVSSRGDCRLGMFGQQVCHLVF